MFKIFLNTSNKFITIGVCIFLWIQFDSIYEKLRGTIESMIVANQVSNDNMVYLWSRLFSEGMIIQVVHGFLGFIMGVTVMRIITTIYANRQMCKQMNNSLFKK